jgi:hypothetical protein
MEELRSYLRDYVGTGYICLSTPIALYYLSRIDEATTLEDLAEIADDLGITI